MVYVQTVPPRLQAQSISNVFVVQMMWLIVSPAVLDGKLA